MSDHDPTYASKLTSLLRRAPSPAPVFIDGGACRGDFTQLLLDAFPTAVIHAFEPDPAMCAGIARRFATSPNVRAWNSALHRGRGRTELQVHADRGTSSLLGRARDTRRYFHSSDEIVARVAATTLDLDTFITEHAPAGIALLKLDTQGSELDILRGAQSALRASAIDVIYTEFFVVPHYAGAPVLADLLTFLGSFGYQLFDLFKGPNARNGQLRFGDAVFVSPSFRAGHVDTFEPEP